MAPVAPRPPPPPASASASDRLTRFVSDNRKALVLALGLTTLVAGGGYYLYSHQQGPTRDADTGSEGKRKKKKKKSGGGANRDASQGGADKQANVQDEQDAVAALLNMSTEAIAGLSDETRKGHANELKSLGNKAYAAKNFNRAVTLYTKAIEFDQQAVFYSNRAACYTNLGETKLVIDDTTAALKLDNKYVKALSRRASARESLGGEDELFQSLCDYTAAAILDSFKTESTSQSVDRVMKKFASEKAQRLMKDRERKLPSSIFIYAYLEAFRKRPVPPTSEDSTDSGDKAFKLAFAAAEAGDYVHALSLFHEAIEQGVSSSEIEAAALNMRATFKFIMADPQGALEDLEKAVKLNPNDTQNYIKRASVHMELGQPDVAFSDFQTAEDINPNDPDIFYHRGQVHFIMGDFEKARQEYIKSIELDPSFVFSHIQRGVAEYKEGNIAKAKALFNKTLQTFESVGEVHNYFGEILLDQKEHTEAIKQFEKAIELMSNQTPRNVLPMINKALALCQWKNDFPAAERLCREALRIDPQCDVGVATLAQLLLQQNKLQDAVESFSSSADMARNEGDLTNALTYEAATRAQLAFVQSYPADAAILGLAVPPS